MLTGEDMARDGVQPMRCGWVLPGMVELPRFALARGSVRHVGEPVAAVFSDSRMAAEDAAEQGAVDYVPLPLIDAQPFFKWAPRDPAAVESGLKAAPPPVSTQPVN